MTPFGQSHACLGHPEVLTNRTCAGCGRPFCDNCLVELQGRHLCADCKTASLTTLQRRPDTVDPRKVIQGARVFDALLIAGAVAGLAVHLVLLALPRGGRTSGLVMVQIMDSISLVQTVLLTIAALALALPPAIGMGPGRKWAYGWQTLAMCGGIGIPWFGIGCLGFPYWIGAAVLLYYWVRPEVWKYFEEGG
jgi:hypothetical protein